MTRMTNEPQTKIVKSYHGGRFCGAVELRITDSPVAMGFSHCDSGRA